MKIYSASDVAEKLAWPDLIASVAHAFADPPEVPLRGHHDIDKQNSGEVTLLTMPAWRSDEYIGVKLVNVVPGNSERGLPTVVGTYVLMSAQTGETLAIIDAPELTARRTAATSALAASKLAHPRAKRHLVVGGGKLSPYLAEAMRSVRSIKETRIWARNPEQAEMAAAKSASKVANDLETAVRQADIISCVTTATSPVVFGAWLSPGSHLDLVGAFRPDMRETDDEAICNCCVFVDTIEGALHQAGELSDPIERGVICAEDVQADLAQLITDAHPGRQSDEQKTLFKSVGSAISDYAAATCLLG